MSSGTIPEGSREFAVEDRRVTSPDPPLSGIERGFSSEREAEVGWHRGEIRSRRAVFYFLKEQTWTPSKPPTAF